MSSQIMPFEKPRRFAGNQPNLAQGRTLILDDMEEMNYVFDLAIHTGPPGRSRAIDRYARSA